MRGYELLDSVMIVLIIDLIALGIIVQIGKSKPMQEISSEINAKIENIEKVCQSMLNSFSEDSIVKKIEERISKQKEDVNYLLDKMSRKMLDLEEKINKFGFSLAEHMESRSSSENNFPIGETVYIETDEEEREQE